MTSAYLNALREEASRDGLLREVGRLYDEIERLRAELKCITLERDFNRDQGRALDEDNKRLRATLESYACPGLGPCTEKRLKDGSCIQDIYGRCGDEARRALEGK